MEDNAAKHLRSPEYQHFQEVSGYDKNLIHLPRENTGTIVESLGITWFQSLETADLHHIYTICA